MHAPRLQAGMEVDGYRLEERLHKGGMAALWRVQDQRTRHLLKDEQGNTTPAPLIMKVPLLYSTDDPTAIVAFEVEQMIMPKLRGEHVPQFFGSGDFEHQPYIVMEQIAGVSLRTRFEQSPLPLDEVVQLGIHIAHALQDLHRQHVIHLDIKPSNIMFRADGTAVLIDFGLSRHDHLPDLLAEEFRLPMGTGPYISPEQVQGIRSEPRSDLFSLAVLLYHLATGQRPFGHPTTVSGLKKRLYQDPLPPRTHRPDMPDWLQEIILQCLEVDPSKRVETAAQFAFLLQHPDQIPLTARANKQQHDGKLNHIKRWFRSTVAEAPQTLSAGERLARAPIIAVALDLNYNDNDLADALRQHTRRLLQTEPSARLACLSVRKTPRIGVDSTLDKDGQNIHVRHLVELKHWARTLELKSDKITCHVLESPDPAAAILDYAHTNRIDHLIVGSRGSSSIRRYLGSVSAQIVAQAECTVTVVKANR